MISNKFILLLAVVLFCCLTDTSYGGVSAEASDQELDEAFLDLIKHFEQEIKAGLVDVPVHPIDNKKDVRYKHNGEAYNGKYNDRHPKQHPNKQYAYSYGEQATRATQEKGYNDRGPRAAHQQHQQQHQQQQQQKQRQQHQQKPFNQQNHNPPKHPHNAQQQYQYQPPHHQDRDEQRRRALSRDEERRRMYEMSRDNDRRHEDTRDQVRRTGQEIISVLRDQLGGYQPQSARRRYPEDLSVASDFSQSPPGSNKDHDSETDLDKIQKELIKRAKALDAEVKQLKNKTEAEHALFVAQNETYTALQLECTNLENNCTVLKDECDRNRTTFESQISNLTAVEEELREKVETCDVAMQQASSERDVANNDLAGKSKLVEDLQNQLAISNATQQRQHTAMVVSNTSLSECLEREKLAEVRLKETSELLNTTQQRVGELSQLRKEASKTNKKALADSEKLYTQCVANMTQQAIISGEALTATTRALNNCQSAMYTEAKKVFDLHVQVQKLTDKLHIIERDGPILCTAEQTVRTQTSTTSTEELPTLDRAASVLELNDGTQTEPSATEPPTELVEGEASTDGPACEDITQQREALRLKESELADKLQKIDDREAACKKEEVRYKQESLDIEQREKQLMKRAKILDDTLANGPGYDIVGALQQVCASGGTASGTLGDLSGLSTENKCDCSKDVTGGEGMAKGGSDDGGCADLQTRFDELQAEITDLTAEAKAAHASNQLLEKRLRYKHGDGRVLEAGILPMYFLRPSLLINSSDTIVWGAHLYVLFSSVLLLVLCAMLAFGLLGSGGLSHAEVDTLLKKREHDVRQHMQQQMDQTAHRRPSMAEDFGSDATPTTDGGANTELQDRLQRMLVERQQMLGDITRLQSDVASRDQQLVEFRQLSNDVMTSVKQHDEDSILVQDLTAALKESERIRELKEKTYFELDSKHMREREAVNSEHAEAVQELNIQVDQLKDMVKARDNQMNDMVVDLSAVNTELEQTRLRAEQADRSRDESMSSQQKVIDELRAEVEALENRCATLRVAEGVEESTAIKELETKHAEILEQVRMERDLCAQRIQEYRDSRDQHARKAAAKHAEQCSRLKVEKDVVHKLHEDIAEQNKAHSVEVKKYKVWRRYLEKELEEVQSELSDSAAELVSINNMYKAAVEILERHRIPVADQVPATLPPAQLEGYTTPGTPDVAPSGIQTVLRTGPVDGLGSPRHVAWKTSGGTTGQSLISDAAVGPMGSAQTSTLSAEHLPGAVNGRSLPPRSPTGGVSIASQGSKIMPSSIPPPPTNSSPILDKADIISPTTPADMDIDHRRSSPLPPPPTFLPPPPIQGAPNTKDAQKTDEDSIVRDGVAKESNAESTAVANSEINAQNSPEVEATPTFFNPSSYSTTTAFPFGSNGKA